MKIARTVTACRGGVFHLAISMPLASHATEYEYQPICRTRSQQTRSGAALSRYEAAHFPGAVQADAAGVLRRHLSR